MGGCSEVTFQAEFSSAGAGVEGAVGRCGSSAAWGIGVERGGGSVVICRAGAGSGGLPGWITIGAILGGSGSADFLATRASSACAATGAGASASCGGARFSTNGKGVLGSIACGIGTVSCSFGLGVFWGGSGIAASSSRPINIPGNAKAGARGECGCCAAAVVPLAVISVSRERLGSRASSGVTDLRIAGEAPTRGTAESTV